jgi:signal transduction histidine kinase
MRKRINYIVLLIFLAGTGILLFQAFWLYDTYKVSKEQATSIAKATLDSAIVEYRRQVANSVRSLVKERISLDTDLKANLFVTPMGHIIYKKEGRNQLIYHIPRNEFPYFKGNPINFLMWKTGSASLSDLLFINLSIPQPHLHYGKRYDEILKQIRDQFDFYKDIKPLEKIVNQKFAEQGISSKAKISMIKGNRKLWEVAPIRTESTKDTSALLEVPLHETVTNFATIFGMDNPLNVQMEKFEAYLQNKTLESDSTYTGRLILDDVNDILLRDIPSLILAVKIPTSYILNKMLPAIIASLILLIFIGGCMAYMFTIILQQKKLSEIKNDFISNISHELKTPISTALAAVQGMQHFDVLKDTDKTNFYLSTASAELQRLSGLVNKILNISIFESSKFILNPVSLNFREMMEQMVMAQQIRPEKPVHIALDYSGIDDIFADKTHLHNAILNLIDNSIKYSADKAEIKVMCRNTADGLNIIISDKGPGIPEDYQKHIFEKFFRVPGSDAHRIKGHGLGLSYAQSIVEKHGGSIVLTDSGPQGTLFTIDLPRNEKL